jgi:hypothetical protein
MINLKQRILRLEAGAGFGEVVFLLANRSRAGIRRKELLDAVSEAVDGTITRRAQILLSATRAVDGSQLHTMVQALAAGPVPPGEINE